MSNRERQRRARQRAASLAKRYGPAAQDRSSNSKGGRRHAN